MLNIYEIPFTEAPRGFDQTGTLMNTLIADIDDETQVIVAFGIDARKSSIAVGNPTAGAWVSSGDTQNWPVFDRLFGRAAWQQFIAEHQGEALVELTEYDEDED